MVRRGSGLHCPRTYRCPGKPVPYFASDNRIAIHVLGAVLESYARDWRPAIAWSRTFCWARGLFGGRSLREVRHLTMDWSPRRDDDCRVGWCGVGVVEFPVRSPWTLFCAVDDCRR